LQLGPQDSGLRLLVASQYLRERKPSEARATLAPIAFDPHGGRIAELAATLITLIDKNGADAALSRWKESEKEAEGGDAG
jgi:hypothetical protein